jgi:hypothetical protein
MAGQLNARSNYQSRRVMLERDASDAAMIPPGSNNNRPPLPEVALRLPPANGLDRFAVSSISVLPFASR